MGSVAPKKKKNSVAKTVTTTVYVINPKQYTQLWWEEKKTQVPPNMKFSFSKLMEKKHKSQHMLSYYLTKHP